MPLCTDIAAQLGQRMLWLGVETATWNLAQFESAARFARAHGIDTLLVKVAEGSYWYGGIPGIKAIHGVIKAQGCDCLDYIYSNGGAAISNEIAMLKELKAAFGAVVADMEEQWNNQVSEAGTLCNALKGTSGLFLVSTWADPSVQAWDAVIRALAPCVDAFMPQQYNDGLAKYWAEFGADGASCIFPSVDLSAEFGANHPAAIAAAAHQQGHASIGLWEYGTAVANTSLVDQVCAAFPRRPLPTPPGDTMLNITDPFAARHFTEAQNANPPRWHCTTTNCDVIGGILAYYRSTMGAMRLPRTNEIYNVIGGGSFQIFEGGVLVYDPRHALDDPGIGNVYAMHLDQNSVGLQKLMELAGIKASPQPAIDTAAIASTAHAIQAAVQAILRDLGQS